MGATRPRGSVANEPSGDVTVLSEPSMLLTRKKYSVPGVRPRTVTAWLVVRPASIPVVEPKAGVVPNSTWLVVGTLVVHSILADDVADHAGAG